MKYNTDYKEDSKNKQRNPNMLCHSDYKTMHKQHYPYLICQNGLNPVLKICSVSN